MTRLLPLLLLACAPAPRPLPAEEAAASASPNTTPSLARALYEAPVAPTPTAEEQRVRLLVWLLRMELSPSQLDRLSALRLVALEQEARLAEAEQALIAQHADEATEIYGALWEGLRAGRSPDDPELLRLAGRLSQVSAGGAREQGLLTLRLEGLRLVLEAERSLLETLSETQEARLAEGLFVLRRQLDPVGTPGDWDALVGPSYEVGAPALLLRGTRQGMDDPLDLGALWATDPRPGETALPEARREAILLLVLRQPGLDEAIAAARALARP